MQASRTTFEIDGTACRAAVAEPLPGLAPSTAEDASGPLSSAASAVSSRTAEAGPRFALPFATNMSAGRNKTERAWRPGRDYRIICDCQRHARTQGAWRATFRLASRGVAVLSIPVTLAMFDIPSEAMNLNVAALSRGELVIERAPKPEPPAAPAIQPPPEPKLEIFTTDTVRKQFLAPDTVEAALGLDVVREQFFRTQIPYGEIIYREAVRNELPPELVAAMVHTESDFRPHLVSHKSAQGLMQIVPSTARLLGIEDPFDPQENIAAGTRYYRYLLNRFSDERIALAAYNAGEGNVERFGGVPPFAETRGYIAKVTRRTHRYRQRVHDSYIDTFRLRSSARAE